MPSYSEHIEEVQARMFSAEPALKLAGQYYDATFRLQTLGLSTPPDMHRLASAIGWPRLYVDSIEERLDVEGFRLPGASETIEELTEWWQANALDEESSLAHLDALVYGRSYVTVAAPGPGDLPGVPIIRVESPLHVWADTDPRTRQVTRAVRLYQRTDGTEPERLATLFLPDVTVNLRHNGGHWVVDGPEIRHGLGMVPVVPIHNRERLADRFGASEITAEIRSFTDAAARTMMNMQAASEMMAVPQRVLFGVNAEDLAGEGNEREILDAYMARFLAVENEQGKAFQFSAAELRNYTEVLQELAKHVASYTGLPPQYLSFASDNPASAEAIRSSESRLVKKSERKARMFGGSWEQVMRLAWRIVRGSIDPEMNRLECMWRDPSTPTFAAKADAITKLYNGGQGVIPRERARIDLGYTDVEREQMREWDEDERDELLEGLSALVPAGQNPDAATSSTARPSAPSRPAAAA